MAVEILWDPKLLIACMYDNTEDVAFGPVFSGPSADQEVQEFIDWLKENAGELNWVVAVRNCITCDGTDPRHYDAGELERLVKFWCELPTEESVA